MDTYINSCAAKNYDGRHWSQRSPIRIKVHTHSTKTEAKVQCVFDSSQFSLIIFAWSSLIFFSLLLPLSYGVNRDIFAQSRILDRQVDKAIPSWGLQLSSEPVFFVVVPFYIGDNEFTFVVLTSESRLEPLESLFRNATFHVSFSFASKICIN